MTIELSSQLEARLQSAVKIMGYETLSPEQDQSVRLNIAGKPTLTLLATGGGKTGCYVIPGIVRNRVSLVVSPLIALQYDQMQALIKKGIPAYLYNSTLSQEEKVDVVQALMAHKEKGQCAFLFVSPESLIGKSFFALAGKGLFDFMAIDEVHCVSTWGNSFRPDYQRLRKAAATLEVPLTGGYTATITSKIKSDIFRYTSLDKDSCRVITGDFNRPNLHLSMIDENVFSGNMKERADKKKGRLLSLTKKARGAVIVYCGSRFGCESLVNHTMLGYNLRKQGFTPYLYHAKISIEEKTKAHQGFENDARPIVFATNAFGMGIDRSDVRLIVHYDNPRSLLGYAQEIGRGGRDGKDTQCITFFDKDKVDTSDVRRGFQNPTVTAVEKIYERLKRAYLKLKANKARESYSTSVFLRSLDYIVGNNDESGNSDLYIHRARQSIALLKQAGCVVEDGTEPFTLYELTPGSKMHGKLIELTQMTDRSEQEQTEALKTFFIDQVPNQELLWQLLR